MRGFAKLTVVQIKLFVREPAALFFTLAFPALLLLLFGAIFGNEPNPEYSTTHGFVDAAVPGFTAIIIASVGLMSIPIGTSIAREQKILRRFRATPLSPATYLAAEVTTHVVMAFLGMVLLVIVGAAVFGLRISTSWGNVMLSFFISATAFCAVGYLIASLARTARVAQVLGQVLFFPMMFLSGASMPRQMMPESLQTAADFLPMTWVVQLLQGAWFNQPAAYLMVLALPVAATLVVATAICTRVFRWE